MRTTGSPMTNQKTSLRATTTTRSLTLMLRPTPKQTQQRCPDYVDRTAGKMPHAYEGLDPGFFRPELTYTARPAPRSMHRSWGSRSQPHPTHHDSMEYACKLLTTHA